MATAAAAVVINTKIIEPTNAVIKVPTARTPNSIVVLLQMCRSPHEVQQVHGQLIVSGLIHHPLNPGRLIESYVSASHFSHALSVFESIPCPDLFAYNTMIRGLMLGPEFPDHLSLLLYQELLSTGLQPDSHTFAFVLKTCSRMNAVSEGKQVQGQMIKAGLELNAYTRNSLIHMYSNCGLMESAKRVLAASSTENVVAVNCMITGCFKQGRVEIARELFEKMQSKDTATWSAMITGYNNCSMHSEAVSLFLEMLANGVRLNESTLVSALCACANSGALDQGRWMHRYVERNDIPIGVNLGTALIDMYAKCGCIDYSFQVFENMAERDVVTWGAIISGFSIHGEARKCLQLFDEMVGNGIAPNEVIFVAILSACSHAGFVELGFHYFDQMVRAFRISPSVEHYGCMADLLGRAGRLAEAEELISSMSEKPNSIIWGALLSACIIYKDKKRGERAVKELIKLGKFSADRYKQFGNFFATVGMEEDAKSIWRLVKDKKLEIGSGLSFIEVDGVVHEFMVGNVSTHSTRSADIFQTLDGMNP